METRKPPVMALLLILYYNIQESSSLSCYECSDSFKRFWKPKDCEFNATNVPTRVCNAQQPYCLVKRVTVKGMVTEIMRDCSEECRYGCEATSFGITKLTCVSCCDKDNCNYGSTGHRPTPHVHPQCLVIFYVVFYVILTTTSWQWISIPPSR